MKSSTKRKKKNTITIQYKEEYNSIYKGSLNYRFTDDDDDVSYVRLLY